MLLGIFLFAEEKKIVFFYRKWYNQYIQNLSYKGVAMKTVFVVNPMAGQGRRVESLLLSIREGLNRQERDGEFYLTKGVGDATSFVRDYCKKNGSARFIACGGDGTLNEVLSGVIGFPDCEIGVVPTGTGNDFCRNFGTEYDFRNLQGQIQGASTPCDAIRYRTQVDGELREGYCLNMFNIGFDCNVADMTARMKKKPLVSGAMAYFLSILGTLIQKKTANLRIELDGEVVHNGKLLLTSVANGCYCGGGIRSNPLASVTDGLLNVNIIRDISRLRFISLLPHYMKGTHINLSGIEKVITTKACRKMKLTPLDGGIRLCIDGEIIDGGVTEFESAPSMVRFVLPGVGVPNKEKEAVLV